MGIEAIKWKTALAIAVSIVLAVTTFAVLIENSYLKNENIHLSTQYENNKKELSEVNQKYSDLQQEIFESNENYELTPPIETRLGIKIMPGIRYPNYLWITGQVENVGNLTLFNAKLRFTLTTTTGTDVKEDVIGTMQSHQIVDVRFTAYSSLGTIVNWKLETVATYRP
jgi:hypothetical protein